jgi:hypothetical protein
MDGIIRPATQAEKNDFNVIGEGDFKNNFLALLSNKQQEYQKKYQPFCFRCALLDIEDKYQSALKEMQRIDGSTNPTDKRLSQINTNMDSYADASRFELLDEAEIEEMRLVNGDKVKVVTGVYLNYKCKHRGCGISIDVPKKEYDNRKTKK